MAPGQLVEVVTRSISSSERSGMRSWSSWSSWSSRLTSTFEVEKDHAGPRLEPLIARADSEESARVLNGSEDGSSGRVREPNTPPGIKYASCSWTKTTALLLAMYIGMAMFGLPKAFSTMGYVPALISAAVIAAFVQYTGLIVWKLCRRHPEAKDICDIGRIVLGGSRAAWIFTAGVFVFNNIAVMGVHIVVGGQYLNTVTRNQHTPFCATVLYCIVITIACFAISLVRTFRVLSLFATASSGFTFVSVITIIFCLVGQDEPANYVETEWYLDAHGHKVRGGEPLFSPWAPEGTTWVEIMVAFLVIAYAFIGHTAIPSFIYEMKDPREFPKVLWTTTITVFVMFIIVGMSIFALTGSQYMTSPSYGGLEEPSKIITFSLMLPTTIILGAMYASITGRFVFFRVFSGSRHIDNHTVKGWASWAGILAVIWTLAFLVSQIVPFFSSLLAVIGAVFDAFFGFIYWAIAWFRMRKADARNGIQLRSARRDRIEFAVNVVMLLIGVCLFLTAGTVASSLDIMKKFKGDDVRGVFSCESNAL